MQSTTWQEYKALVLLFSSFVLPISFFFLPPLTPAPLQPSCASDGVINYNFAACYMLFPRSMFLFCIKQARYDAAKANKKSQRAHKLFVPFISFFSGAKSRMRGSGQEGNISLNLRTKVSLLKVDN